MFYTIIESISETDHIKNFTGFGLYDKSFLDIIRNLNEPYPYFRGMVAEYGPNRIEISYAQEKRGKGKSKNNLYNMYDSAMLGFVSHSKVPLRLATFTGLLVSFLSIIVALFYFFYKIFVSESLALGVAPLVIGIFFFGAVQLIFLGITGEYVGTILTEIKNRPLVIEKERINFDK